MESLWTILYIMRALCVHYARICEVDTLCVNCEHVVYVICTLRTVVCSLYTWCTLHLWWLDERWLDDDDPCRNINGAHPIWGQPEDRPTPAVRTHDTAYTQSLAARDHEGYANAHPKHTTGINGWCVLGMVPMFNVIWDVCPDLMHVVKNLFDRMIIPLFSGERFPSAPTKNVKPSSNDTNYRKLFEEWEIQQKKYTVCTQCQHNHIIRTFCSHYVQVLRILHHMYSQNCIRSTLSVNNVYSITLFVHFVHIMRKSCTLYTIRTHKPRRSTLFVNNAYSITLLVHYVHIVRKSCVFNTICTHNPAEEVHCL